MERPMAHRPMPDAYWSPLSAAIADAMGLHFPRERWPELQHGLTGAAQDSGFGEDVTACADWLLSSPLSKAQQQILASHLTIGETYFFRDKPTLAALSEHILPALIQARRGREPRLRLWSAACCTGEEPYTLAILLHQLLPDLADWQVSILGTDINPRFLHKAAAGVYGEWSFRDVAEALKQRYFIRTRDGRYAVIPEIRRLVSFAPLNLVEDMYPSPVTATNAMDLVCCRNVLMYFSAPQIAKVVGKLRHALVVGGWMALGPSEMSHAASPGFATVYFPGAILVQKSAALPRTVGCDLPLPSSPANGAVLGAGATTRVPPDLPPIPFDVARVPHEPASAETSSTPHAAAESLYQRGSYAEAADTLAASMARDRPDAKAFSLLVRALANQGKLADALAWSERWLAADKVHPGSHYLRALVLLEQGDADQAHLSLQRALFLHPDFALAHFALGNLARGRGRHNEARRHFTNALQVLRRSPADDLLAESDGLRVGRLTEIISAMSAAETTP